MEKLHIRYPAAFMLKKEDICLCARPKRLIKVESGMPVLSDNVWNECCCSGGYVTVSYTWGHDEYIDFKNIVPWKLPMSAKVVLYKALHAAKIMQAKFIWMDAWCINQEDNDEKSKEVSNMGRYYENAMVCIVIIPELEGTQELIDFCKEINNRTFKQKSTLEDDIGKCPLADCLWLTRKWTLQEAFCSKKLIAYINGELIDLDEVIYITASYYKDEPGVEALLFNYQLSELRRHGQEREKIVEYCKENKYRLLLDLVILRSKVLDKSKARAKLYSKCSFAEAVQLAKNRKCKEPLDSLYSIIGIIEKCTVSASYSTNNKPSTTLLEIIQNLKTNGDNTWLQLSTQYDTLMLTDICDISTSVIANSTLTPNGNYRLKSDNDGIYIETKGWSYGKIININDFVYERCDREHIKLFLRGQGAPYDTKISYDDIVLPYISKWCIIDADASKQMFQQMTSSNISEHDTSKIIRNTLKVVTTDNNYTFVVNGTCNINDSVVITACNSLLVIRQKISDNLRKFIRTGHVASAPPHECKDIITKLKNGNNGSNISIYVVCNEAGMASVEHFLNTNADMVKQALMQVIDDEDKMLHFVRILVIVPRGRIGISHFNTLDRVYSSAVDSNDTILMLSIVKALEKVLSEFSHDELVRSISISKKMSEGIRVYNSHIKQLLSQISTVARNEGHTEFASRLNMVLYSEFDGS